MRVLLIGRSCSNASSIPSEAAGRPRYDSATRTCAYSGLSGRLFRLIPATYSGFIRPPFPGDGGHPAPWGSGALVNLR